MDVNARKNAGNILRKRFGDMTNRYAVHAVGTVPSPQYLRAECKHSATRHDAPRSRGKTHTRCVFAEQTGGRVDDERTDISS
jgi:hypothetical protein